MYFKIGLLLNFHSTHQKERFLKLFIKEEHHFIPWMNELVLLLQGKAIATNYQGTMRLK